MTLRTIDATRDPISGFDLVGFHLLVDLVLHTTRIANVVKALRSILRSRFDIKIAEAEHAFENSLMEENRVDPLERNLDSVLRDDARSENHTI
ncbi:unannotated protein [freshwater metagenome]|uniref:Unannotated protein n=1 Tax=freshwater metagenome TaxID=449393 RepID=A0A6J6A0K0_9ZZZZ